MSSDSSPLEQSQARRHRRSSSPRHESSHQKRRRIDPNQSTQELGLMRDGAQQGLPRFVGSGSGIYFIRTVYQKLAKSLDAQCQALQGSLVPGEDDQIQATPGRDQVDDSGNIPDPSSMNYWLPGELLCGDQAQNDRAPFESLVKWTRPYFKHWHPAFPILNGPAILKIFEDISNHGIGRISQTDAVVVRSIMSLSLADSRQSKDEPTSMPPRLLFADNASAISGIQFALLQPASIPNLQAALVMQLFFTSMLKFNIASRLGGVIVKMAFHLGLHRCPSRFANFSAMESQTRRRVFWSMYCLERILCQSLGTPLDIRDDDIDVCYPGEEFHTDKDHTRSPELNVAHLKLLTLLSKHARIRGMILELRNKSLTCRNDSIDFSIPVQAELATWYNSVEDMIESENLIDGEDGSQTKISSEHRYLLQMLNHESIISLNRPLVTSTVNKAASAAALQNCISSSRSIISILDDFRLKSDDRSDMAPILQIPFLWPLCTWSVWMSCFILAFAAMDTKSMIPSAQRYARKTLSILHHLSLRRTFWPDSCAEAVQQVMVALSARSDPPNLRSGQENLIHVMPSPSSMRSDLTSAVNNGESSSQSSSGVAGISTHVRGGFGRNKDVESTIRRQDTVPDHIPSAASLSATSSTGFIDFYYTNDFVSQIMDDYNFDPLGAIDLSNFAVGNSGTSSFYGFQM